MKQKTLIKSLLGLGGLLALVEPALAANLGQLADGMAGQGQGIANLISTASYVGAAGFGVKGGLKLKEHSEDSTKVRLSQPLTLLGVSGILAALPSTMDTGTESIFGDNARKAGKSRNLSVE
jgi:hypothetical protein